MGVKERLSSPENFGKKIVPRFVRALPSLALAALVLFPFQRVSAQQTEVDAPVSFRCIPAGVEVPQGEALPAHLRVGIDWWTRPLSYFSITENETGQTILDSDENQQFGDAMRAENSSGMFMWGIPEEDGSWDVLPARGSYTFNWAYANDRNGTGIEATSASIDFNCK